MLCQHIHADNMTQELLASSDVTENNSSIMTLMIKLCLNVSRSRTASIRRHNERHGLFFIITCTNV